MRVTIAHNLTEWPHSSQQPLRQVICFFSKLNCSVRTKLFQTYCNSKHGCELWSLYDNSINDFDVAWRKAVRRVLNIPYDTHSNLIPLLMSNTLPFIDEICKRSARFILSFRILFCSFCCQIR